ncbi:PAS domain-containing hybrid sensor histidine kinase/response regulator [Caenimonas soli]|uniref:PAS domain-containing hybrid sensor histidine kinase/response regulator n=1 Tax=Caenimonas soli TaxID=2735555 RepID=UPI001553EC6F|nr:PAS domain-containing sensor histidine kinase [Caenimonas soli]NPC57755.1 PAS domain S-box protein [Caenimonas soli]
MSSRRDDTLEGKLQLLIEAVIDYGIFILDPQGFIMSWNTGAEKLKGYKASEIIGRHFSTFYSPEAVASGWPEEELRRAVRDGRVEDEGWRIRKDGSRFWANVTITPIYGDDGVLTGYAKVTRDLTERRAHEEQLRASEERFRLLVESVRDYAIFMLDPDGIVRSWNAGAQATKGYTADEIIGRHFSAFYTPEDRESGKPARGLRTAIADGRMEDEGWRVRKDGSVFWADVVITAIRGRTGELIGFAKVTRDMTERRRFAELERSSQMMNEFLAMLAHELRNPLAPMRNAVTVMQLESLPSPALRNCRDIIDRQLTHVTRLVDDLLDIGRLTTGKVKLHKELVRVGEVVSRSVETVGPLVESRRHSLTVDLPEQPIYVDGDATRLSQILQNLLINAAKYTPEGGRIALKVEAADGLVMTSVSDNGRGIAPDDLETIFELFKQGVHETPHESGLGIGLTLARSLAEMHGGMLEARSPGPGQGSTFTFRMPVADTAVGSEAAAATEADKTVRRVMVVDDNRDAADTTTAILRLLGNQAECAYTGREALELAKRFRANVVFMDIAMPGMDGFETLRALRAQPGWANVFAIAVTGFGTQDDKKRTLAAGFDGHLTKPVELDALVALLNQSSGLS